MAKPKRKGNIGAQVRSSWNPIPGRIGKLRAAGSQLRAGLRQAGQTARSSVRLPKPGSTTTISAWPAGHPEMASTSVTRKPGVKGKLDVKGLGRAARQAGSAVGRAARTATSATKRSGYTLDGILRGAIQRSRDAAHNRGRGRQGGAMTGAMRSEAARKAALKRRGHARGSR